MELTDEQKKIFEQWVIENICCDDIIPADEGNDEAFVFNLVHAIRGDNERWDYLPHQYAECEKIGITMGDNISIEDTLPWLRKYHPDYGKEAEITSTHPHPKQTEGCSPNIPDGDTNPPRKP